MPKEMAVQTAEQPSVTSELEALNIFLDSFIDKHNVSFQEAVELLKGLRHKGTPTLIPASIFKEKRLGILECVCKYLKESLHLSYHQLAILLKRDDRVIWVTYNNARKKLERKLQVQEPTTWLPVSIFTDKKLGPLESITHHLHDTRKLSFNEIAKLLDRDNRTIWASNHTAKKKLQKGEAQ